MKDPQLPEKKDGEQEPIKKTLPPPAKKKERDDDDKEERGLNKRRSREAKNEAKEEEEELTDRAFMLKLLVERNGKLNDLEVKLLEMFFKNQARTEKRLTNLYVEQRRFCYMQTETLSTMNQIVSGALQSNVDLVNKYGELKAQGSPSKAQETLELVNGILAIPALAAMQNAAVLYMSSKMGGANLLPTPTQPQSPTPTDPSDDHE